MDGFTLLGGFPFLLEKQNLWRSQVLLDKRCDDKTMRKKSAHHFCFTIVRFLCTQRFRLRLVDHQASHGSFHDE